MPSTYHVVVFPSVASGAQVVDLWAVLFYYFPVYASALQIAIDIGQSTSSIL